MEDSLGQLKNHSYELSPLDIIPNHLYLTSGFFFENGEAENGQFMPKEALIASFYDSLQSFPILAARLHCHGLNKMKLVVDRNNPNLPVWEECQSDLHFLDIKKHGFHRDYWPESINIADPLVYPGASGSRKLIRVRFCRFAKNSGVALVVRIAHCVFDAKGYTFFMNHWAACCRKRLHLDITVSPCQPILDRAAMYKCLPRSVQPTPLEWPLWPVSFILTALLSLLGLWIGKMTTTGASESHLFYIPRHTLNRLTKGNRGNPRISDNDIITALFTMVYAQLWQKDVPKPSFVPKRKKIPNKVTAIVPCDFRHRLGVPQNFTGSCAIGLYVTSPMSLLLQPISSPALSSVAALSRQTVDEVDAKVIEGFTRRAMLAIKLVGDKARVLYSLMVCQAFSNQSRLPFYEVDFGFGRPRLVVPMAYSKSLAVIVPPPPPSQDVYVYLTLEVEDMAAILQNEDFMAIAKIVY